MGEKPKGRNQQQAKLDWEYAGLANKETRSWPQFILDAFGSNALVILMKRSVTETVRLCKAWLQTIERDQESFEAQPEATMEASMETALFCKYYTGVAGDALFDNETHDAG